MYDAGGAGFSETPTAPSEPSELPTSTSVDSNSWNLLRVAVGLILFAFDVSTSLRNDRRMMDSAGSSHSSHSVSSVTIYAGADLPLPFDLPLGQSDA